jgi:hypothetical protein
MSPEQVCKSGNEAVAQMCRELIDVYGPGKEYEMAVTSAATTLMFHVYRLARRHGKVTEILQNLLDDVTHNVRQVDEAVLKFKVEER